MNWFMPALARSKPDSRGGISDEDGTRRCPRASKNSRKVSRIRFPFIGSGHGRAVGLVARRGGRRHVELAAQLGLALIHRSLALSDGLADELPELEDATLRLARDRRGS